MASSNRHWPSMFKTKSFNSHHPWLPHHDNNNNSNAPQKSSSGDHQERVPEPKPRWNPRPEQIRILETIFNSGTVNPSRDEIRKIRSQLQEYGQVGDANVFYWFQNRKSRTKHKQRHLQKPPKSIPPPPPPPSPPPIFSLSSSSSFSSSSLPPVPPPSPFLQNQEINGFLKPPLPTTFLPILGQGFSSSPFDNNPQFLDDQSSFLLSDFLLGFTTKNGNNYNYSSNNNNQINVSSSTSNFSAAALSPIHHHTQGGGGGGGESCIISIPPIKSSVFINDVAYDVTLGPFNVREAFGEDAILIHSNGQPILTNEWGVALEPLQHGAFYYLIRTLPPHSPLDTASTTNLV